MGRPSLLYAPGKYLRTVYELLPSAPNPGLKWKEIWENASKVHKGISTETVCKYLDMLVKHGLVERTKGKDGRTRMYRRFDLASLYLKEETLTAIRARYENKLKGIDEKHVPAVIAKDLIRWHLINIVGYLLSGLSFSLQRKSLEEALTSLNLLIEAQVSPLLEKSIKVIYPSKGLKQLTIQILEDYLSDIEYFDGFLDDAQRLTFLKAYGKALREKQQKASSLPRE